MRSVLGPSVWSAAQYMVILYFVRELFKFCWEACWPCIVLLNEMHIFCQTLNSWVFSHDGRLRAERFGCFWHGKTSLLGWFPGKKMDDMLWCCILDDMLTHSFLYAWLCCSLVNEHLQAVMDTNLKAAMNQEASSSGDIIVFFSYNCDVTLSWCMAFLTITDILSLVDKIIFC